MKTIIEGLATAGYRVTLEGGKIRLHYERQADPDPALVVPLIKKLQANKATAVAYLQQRAPLPAASAEADTSGHFKTLCQAIHQAVSWSALEAILDDVQTAYQIGDLSQDEAENLGQLAMQKAHMLPETAEAAPPLRLSELFAADPVRRVWSAVLEEEVLFLADGAKEPEGNTLIIYRQSELHHLVGVKPTQLKAAHLAKKMFDGEVLSEDAPPITAANRGSHAGDGLRQQSTKRQILS